VKPGNRSYTRILHLGILHLNVIPRAYGVSARPCPNCLQAEQVREAKGAVLPGEELRHTQGFGAFSKVQGRFASPAPSCSPPQMEH